MSSTFDPLDANPPLTALDRETGFGTYCRMRLIYWFILAAMCLPLDAYAASGVRFIPDCAGRVDVAQTRVARVEQDGTLVLGDGRILLLEGVRLALGDGAPPSLSKEVLAALRALALSGPVTFTSVEPGKDRYGRVRVQAFGRQWFQTALLEQGLARVAISPDRTECAPDLYEAEARGRTRRAGLWAIPAYAPRTPQAMRGAGGTFQMVEGLVVNVGQADGRMFIDMGRDGRPIFSAVIGVQDRRAFRDFDVDGLSGRRIRVRGVIQDYRGRPEIALSNPSQIEVLD